MKFMAMLLLNVLAVVTNAVVTDCVDPPAPATQAWLAEVVKSRCTVVNGDLHLGWNCTDGDSCSGPAPVEAHLLNSVDLGFVKTITGRLTCYGNKNIETVIAKELTNAGAVEIATATMNGTDRRASNLQMTSLALPALVDVSGDVLFLFNGHLTSVGMGALQTVGGYLDIGVNDMLTSVGMGALQTVGGYLRIEFNNALTSVGMGALQTIEGYLTIDNNPELESVDFWHLRRLGSVDEIADNKDALTFKLNGCFDSSVLDREGVNFTVIPIEGVSCSPTSSSSTAAPSATATAPSSITAAPSKPTTAPSAAPSTNTTAPTGKDLPGGKAGLSSPIIILIIIVSVVAAISVGGYCVYRKSQAANDLYMPVYDDSYDDAFAVNY